MAQGAVVRKAAAGTTLFREGDPARGLIVLMEGTVRVVGERDGRQHLVHESGPGETLGEVPLFAGGGYPATAIAQTDCVYAVYLPETITEIMKHDPQFVWGVLKRMALRVRELVKRLERNTAWSVEGRLAEILLSHHAAAGGKAFRLGVRQAQLAEELGTVREVLVRTLAEFVKQGLISREKRGWYRVRKAERLGQKAK